MKKHLYICAALVAFSCGNEPGGSPDGGKEGELTFSSSVAGRTDATVSRATGDEFFGNGYEIDVFIETSSDATTRQFNYSYQGNNLFTSSAPFRFNLDDTYITYLKAMWPRQEVRNQGLITDQRELENFRLADWLTAEATSLEIMPTDAAVPLVFERDNVLVEFEIAGQNAEGVDIKELVIEIEVEGTPTAFWAYCGDENGHAQILLDETTSLSSTEEYLIGRMKVTDNYTYTIIFPAVDIELKKGHRYLVTLTSQGYDIDGYVYIGGWQQDPESGIGIPFAAPEPIGSDTFVINDPMQLVTMSYLIRHYPNPATFDWTTATYVISDSLVLTEEYADLYIPVPRGQYPSVVIRNEAGDAVTTIPYGAGQELQLFTD